MPTPNQQKATGHTTGNYPRIAQFDHAQGLRCKYRDMFIATSAEELRNHYASTHSEGGPRPDPRGEYVALDGKRFPTLPERIAYEQRTQLPAGYKEGGSGVSYTTAKTAAVAEHVRRHTKRKGAFSPLRGDV